MSSRQLNLPPDGPHRPSQPAPSGLATTLRGLPNWAVGLFGGLGVLAVGLGIFSLILRAESPAPQVVSPAAPPRAVVAPEAPAEHKATRDARLPAAVVEQHLAPAGREAGGVAPAAPAPALKRLAPRPRRLRPATGVGAQATETEDVSPEPGEVDAPRLPAPPAAVEPEKKVAVAEEPAPRAEPAADSTREADTLADAEKLQSDMEAILVSLAPRIEACARTAAATGAVEVRVSVGADGAVKASRLLGDLATSAASSCIQDLVKGTTYPRFSGASIKLSHRFVVE